MIYKVFDNNTEYQSFHIDMEEFLDVMDSSIGEQDAMQFSQLNIAMADNWEPLRVSYTQNEDCGNALPDIGIWKSASLILSERAAEVLKPLISEYGEFLPVTCVGNTHYVFNCLTNIDADKAASVRVMEGEFFMDVAALTFPEATKEVVFKSSFENSRNIFCSEAFKDAVESNGLGGIYFGEDLVSFM
jgi:hypothetical protein